MPETMIEREAKLFEAGEYADKNMTVTEANLDTVVSNFQEAPVKIEHRDSPLDGALGSLKSVSRKGKELFGKIAFTREAWTLIDKAGARKLSVSLKRDFSGIPEVSLVKNPRVSGAAVFDDRIEAVGTVEFGFGGLSVSEIREQIRDILQPKVPDPLGGYTRPGPYIWVDTDKLYEDHVIVNVGESNFDYPFAVTDGSVSLGEPVEVEQVWRPKAAAAAMSDSRPERGVDEMPEINSDKVAFSKDEVQDLVSKAKQEAIDAAKAEFSAELDKVKPLVSGLMAENRALKVGTIIDRLKRAGKLTPAAEPFARELLACGDSTTVEFSAGEGESETLSLAALFERVMDAQPAVVKFAESAPQEEAKESFSSEATSFFEKLGVSAEDVAKYADR